jgi:hypothetical protein
MKCPSCGEHSPPAWQLFETYMTHGYVSVLPAAENVLEEVSVAWMRCSNEECNQLVIRVHEQRLTGLISPILRTDSWDARPRFGGAERATEPLVPEPFRTDYAEAAAILNISPRMSAVLSRRILSDLLRKYAAKEQGRLTVQIDAFTAESGHPSGLTSNLHHFRTVGDFGAHTQEDKEDGQIIDVDHEEAEWTLDLVDRLFDYFIVQPAKDEQIKQRMDAKIERAGREPLRPPAPPEDE